MKEQHPDLWPPDGDRPRHWRAHSTGEGGAVLLRHYAILEPGEDLTEYPKTIELTWQEWLDSHAYYGLNADGTRIEGTD